MEFVPYITGAISASCKDTRLTAPALTTTLARTDPAVPLPLPTLSLDPPHSLQACSMDAGFIKTEHQGQLITLGIRDDDNKILMVAAAIVDKEDESSYTYFLSNCMKSPDFAAIFNDPSMTVFVDGHKGSPPALRKCTPLMEVYRCLQHYLKNAPAIGPVSPIDVWCRVDSVLVSSKA